MRDTEESPCQPTRVKRRCLAVVSHAFSLNCNFFQQDVLTEFYFINLLKFTPRSDCYIPSFDTVIT